MTIEEFQDAVEDNGLYIVHVKEHKTATPGPRPVTFEKETYQLTKLFVKYIRNMLSGVGKHRNDKVFVSLSGKRMSSSLINDQWSAFFEKASGVVFRSKKRKVTATLVRKTFVSKGHTYHPESKRDLANTMCLSEKVANDTFFGR